ncbi:MAG: biopolymer transporter ExbD [Myxococcales bacterium]|nr:biopolymer transporter ExbD [Myxococcales bacterium]
MSVSVESGGGGGRKSVDVEINLVPFIDMMSCLVAFLLITAVWTNLAQIPVAPKGLGKSDQPPPANPPTNIAVLIGGDSQWIGVSTGERQQIRKLGDGAYNFADFETVVKGYKESPTFSDRTDIEIAAEDGVHYQVIITTMDILIMNGFKDVGFTDPGSLTVPFKQ